MLIQCNYVCYWSPFWPAAFRQRTLVLPSPDLPSALTCEVSSTSRSRKPREDKEPPGLAPAQVLPSIVQFPVSFLEDVTGSDQPLLPKAWIYSAVTGGLLYQTARQPPKARGSHHQRQDKGSSVGCNLEACIHESGTGFQAFLCLSSPTL